MWLQFSVSCSVLRRGRLQDDCDAKLAVMGKLFKSQFDLERCDSICDLIWNFVITDPLYIYHVVFNVL